VAGHGDKRSRRQELAIAALLCQPTLDKAAQAAGISPRTLKGWLTEPTFQATYREARRRTVEQAIGQLQRACGKAVRALVKNLACDNPAARNAAAKAILEQAVKGVELADVLERLERLEQLGCNRQK
jgi:hypothetical protein